MRARTKPFLAFFTILAGAALAGSVTSVGCGGSVDEQPAQPDTAPVDTGITIIDTTPADTGTPMMDSEMTYDVPGSLFDATVPDVVFEGGKTSGGCYACTLDKCKAEVAECDKDPRCRGLFLCVLTDCAGSFTDFGCAAGCAFKFGVTGLSDPIIGKAQAVGGCVNMQCSAECPAPPAMGDGGMDGSAVSDAMKAEVGGSGFKSSLPSAGGAKDLQTIDPKVVEVLMDLGNSFHTPAARDEMAKHFSH